MNILIYAVIKFFVGIIIAIFSLYTGVKMFDHLTKGIEEWKEMKEGNVAVAIYMGGVIFTLAIIIHSLMTAYTLNIPSITPFTLFIASAWDLAYALTGMFIGVITIYLSIKVLDYFTKDVDELEEIKRGNIAIAIFVALILFAVGFLVRGVTLETLEVLKSIHIFH